MPRMPMPWWRKDRNAWFVQIERRQHNLGPDREEALRKFHELMAKPKRRVIATDSVLGVIDLFLEWVSNNRKPDTYGCRPQESLRVDCPASVRSILPAC